MEEKKGGERVERLDKALSDTGKWSRKEAREVIRAGRAAVNGTVVTDPEAKVEPAAVTVDGCAITGKHVYLMLNKPAGVVTATEDRREKTVLDLLPQEYRRRGVFPVGRLDKDTEGLLLLTDDGAWGHDLTAPRKHVDKVYRVTVEGVLTEGDQAALEKGLVLGDGLRCLPAGLERTETPNVGLLTLREGKFHQVKRMMAALGKPVVALKRIRVGNVTLDPALRPGEWRALTEGEVSSISTKNF